MSRGINGVKAPFAREDCVAVFPAILSGIPGNDGDNPIGGRNAAAAKIDAVLGGAVAPSARRAVAGEFVIFGNPGGSGTV